VVNGFVADLLTRDPSANVIVLGDFNDFAFSAPLTALAGTVLTDLVASLPEGERYSYVFEGNSQTLDHILVSGQLAAGGPQFAFVHADAEFSDPSRASDHDPALARFWLPPPVVQLSATSFSVGEGAGTAVITTTLSFAAAMTVSVQLATADGTATGGDYTPVSTTLTFRPGMTGVAALIPILDDALYEGDETVGLALSAPTVATLGAPNTATLTIRDDDLLPTPTATATSTPRPNGTPSATPTETPRRSPTNTATPTPTVTPTATPTPIPTYRPSPTPTATPTASSSPTSTATDAPTRTATVTPSAAPGQATTGRLAVPFLRR
jgi:hypothetical protein